MTTTTDKAIYVHGPQGCGKTINAAALAQHYGKRVAIDFDELEGPEAPDDALVLCVDPVPGSISFQDAMREAGLTASNSDLTQWAGNKLDFERMITTPHDAADEYAHAAATRPCVACRHVDASRSFICTNPAACPPDVVRGIAFTRCEDARAPSGKCGVSGRFFDALPRTPESTSQ